MVLDAQEVEVLITADKIVVIQTAFIGDAVLTLPFLQRLREGCPKARIDVVAQPLSAGIFSNSPAVDNVHILEKRGAHKSIKGLLKFAKMLRRENYELLFAPHRSLRTALLTLLTMVKETYGFANSSFPFAYKHTIPYLYGEHEVKRLLRFLEEDALAGEAGLPIIHFEKRVEEKTAEFIAANCAGKRLAAIAPGSVWETKKYPVAYYKELLRYLSDKGFTVLLIGSSSEKEYCEKIRAAVPGESINCSGLFSLVESIRLLHSTELLITNDSAPTHLGVCADIPVLTLYCSTVPEFGFYPYNRKSRCVSYDQLSCKPCGIHGYNKCPLGHFDCGMKLKPETVIQSIEEMMNEVSR